MERNESIGEVGWSDRGLWLFASEWALQFLELALGDPPDGIRIGTLDHAHELGTYSTIAVFWREGYPEPWGFIRRAEDALATFNEAVDWVALDPSNFEEGGD